MGEAENSSVLRTALKNLCVGNGWSYGVFWCFDQRNPMLLSLEDAYFEDPVGAVIENMLSKIHMLGEGIIGQTALNGKYQWIQADGQSGEWNSFRSTENQHTFQDDSEVCYQFSSGIKTIVVVPVEPRGLVQLGSTEKIPESLEFVDQTMRLFHEKENLDVFSSLENANSYEKVETYDINGLFASLISSQNSSNEFIPVFGDDNYKQSRENNCSALNSNQCSPSVSDIHHEKMTFSNKNEAFLDGFFCDGSISQLEQAFSFNSDSAATKSCISTRSSEYPTLASLNQELVSESRIRDSSDAVLSGGNSLVPCKIQEDASLSSLYNAGNVMDNQHQQQQPLSSDFATQSCLSEKANSLNRFPERLFEEFEPVEYRSELFNFGQLDDLSQWFASSPDQTINRMINALNGDLTQLVESTTTSTSASLAGVDKHALNAEEQEKSGIIQGDENDTMMPLVTGCYPSTSSASGKCISGLNPTSGPRKGLFSELGIEELLAGSNKSNLEDESSSSPLKRRKIESSSVSSTNQSHLSRLADSNGNLSLLQYNTEKTTNNLVNQKELPKSQVGLWIDDSYSIIGASSSTVLSQPQMSEEPKKVVRKRARPGESTRPRPKDRQLIQDRIKELRGIIPSGGKCSIDSLLDRTIKYMLFLQGVTKYADKLKQSNKPKLINNDNGAVLRDNNTSSSAGGVTWAFEVGGQSMACPIIVEDLSPPGQMLIEMLCEEHGFFLEIADIIRGFGLSILKGVMEVRGNKIWAHFIVEASSHVTRIDVFWSLVQLLQQTSTTDGIDSTNLPSNVVMDGGIPLFENYQKPNLPPPICLTETLH